MQVVSAFALSNKNDLIRDDYHKLMRAFRALDPERKGYIDAELLGNLMSSRGEAFNAQESTAMLRYRLHWSNACSLHISELLLQYMAYRNRVRHTCYLPRPCAGTGIDQSNQTSCCYNALLLKCKRPDLAVHDVNKLRVDMQLRSRSCHWQSVVRGLCFQAGHQWAQSIKLLLARQLSMCFLTDHVQTCALERFRT